jgi:hypothetical protein
MLLLHLCCKRFLLGSPAAAAAALPPTAIAYAAVTFLAEFFF